MKTSPAETIREADRKQPVRRATFHSTAHAVAEAPAPRAAGTRAADTGGMSMSDAIALLADTEIRNALHAQAEPRRAARLIMLTVQGACRDCGVAALETISLIARIMVRVTSQLGGNVAAVTTSRCGSRFPPGR